MQNKRKKLLLIGCLLWTAYLCAGCKGQSAVEISSAQTDSLLRETDPYARSAEAEDDDRESGDLKDEPEEAQESVIYVQVCGAVKQPGVYGMHEGDRVFEAIALAGGLTAEANAQSVNQASKVEDGQMITVRTNEEWEESPDEMSASTDDGRIDINRADAKQLTALPGIGEAIAGRIVTYREQNGPFSKIEDIRKVSGIGDKLFEKIKDLIRV